MIKFIKNLFKSESMKTNNENEDILSKISLLAYNENTNKVFYSPEAKLYIMNCYSRNFDELASLVYTKGNISNLTSINIQSYFNNSSMNISNILQKLLPHLYENVIDNKVKHDLYEIYESFVYLESLRSK